MKKNKQKADTKQPRAPQFGRLTLLVGALVASGVLSPLTLPQAVASPLHPLPVPCGGCVNNSGVAVSFLQAGQPQNAATWAYIDPLTGLPSDKNLTITQNTQVAILNWKSFDIDRGYTVTFQQPSATSSALNRIWDAGPSHISGNLNANGQIYLINHNGIVFHNGAQVNTNTLIASSWISLTIF